jgi:hypothetical protein
MDFEDKKKPQISSGAFKSNIEINLPRVFLTNDPFRFQHESGTFQKEHPN